MPRRDILLMTDLRNKKMFSDCLRQARWQWLSLVASLSIFAGCGPGGPAIYPVSGSVMVGGQPVSSVQVSLMPIAGKQQVAAGVTDAAGQFRLTWGSTARAGAEVGRYKVVLNQLSTETEADVMERYSGKGGKAPKDPKPPFPKEYSSAETSPQEVEVTAGANTLDIAIE